jgi:hypothetical protein
MPEVPSNIRLLTAPHLLLIWIVLVQKHLFTLPHFLEGCLRHVQLFYLLAIVDLSVHQLLLLFFY